jgi:hypothetical protein
MACDGLKRLEVVWHLMSEEIGWSMSLDGSKKLARIWSEEIRWNMHILA